MMTPTLTRSLRRPRSAALALIATAAMLVGATVTAAPATAVPVDAPLVADAFVRDGSYADDTNVTGTLAWKAGSAGFARETYLTFDVADLDDVDRATLWLYGRVSGGSAADYPDSVPNLVTEVLDPSWTPNDLTWNTRPEVAPEPALQFVLGGGQDQTNQWHAVDLTDLVAGAVAADQDLLSIRLSRNVSSGPIVQLSSSRTSNGPRLEINGAEPAPTPATRQQIAPVQDAYVRDGSYADTSYATAGTLQWKVGSVGTAREAYLMFDLSDLDGAVENAVLRLYGRVSGGSASDYPDATENLITEVLDTWTAEGLTWNTRPALTDEPVRTFLIGGEQGQTNRWHEVDLSDLVIQALVEGREVISIAITRETATAPLPQVSSTRSSNPPVLEINGPTAVEPPADGVVHSALYPEDWQPGDVDDEGRFLHDFSYAGYRYGADVPDAVDGPVVDVTQAPYGADPTGVVDSTLAIQAAIDAVGAQGGGTVYLPAGEYRVSTQDTDGRAVLHLGHDDVLLRGDGPDQTRIYNASSAHMRSRAVVLIGAARDLWVNWLDESVDGVPLTQDITAPTTTLHVSDTSGFAVGDWVLLRSDTTEEWIAEHPIDTSRHTWTPETLRGQVYERQLTAVDHAAGTVTIDIPTRYTMLLRDGLRLAHATQPVTGSGVADLAIGMRQSDLPTSSGTEHTTPGTVGYEAHGSSAIAFNAAVHGWVDNVHSYRPADNADEVHLLSGGVHVWHARSITVTHTDMRHAQYLGEGGNGYLYHLMGSDTLVRDSYAEEGRHNYLIQAIQATGNVILDSTSVTATHATELHRHLSVANLFDNVHVIGDTFEAQYRNSSTHAHSGTESVMWNISGESCTRGRLAVSQQFGWGYVIGTSGEGDCRNVSTPGGTLTAPVDWTEHIGLGEYLEPRSLYLDQRERRLENEPVEPPVTEDGPATAAPGVAALSTTNGWSGLTDGTFEVRLNLWWGQNATGYRVYENGVLLETGTLTDATPAAQVVTIPVTGRANGTYVYTAVLTNRHGSTEATSTTAVVAQANPGTGVLSHDNWDRDGDYRVTFNLWWGTNGTSYRLYENGALVDTVSLTAATPRAQQVVTALEDRAPGTYTYRAELENAAGVTTSSQITVTVTG